MAKATSNAGHRRCGASRPLRPLSTRRFASLQSTWYIRLAEAFPVLAVAPIAVLPGPYDPGGVFAKANLWISAGVVAGLVALCRRRRRRCR